MPLNGMEITMIALKLFVLLVVVMVGCDAAASTPTLPPTITPTLTANAEVLLVPSSTKIIQVTPVPTGTPERPTTAPDPNSTPIPSSTPDRVQTSFIQGCPEYQTPEEIAWSSSPRGYALYSLGQLVDMSPFYAIVEPPGIWATSLDGTTAQIMSDRLRDVSISPNGNLLFAVTEGTDGVQAVRLNLLNGETKRIPFSPTPSLFTTSKWLPNGQIQFQSILEPKMGVGETREMFTFDFANEQAEKSILDLMLPEYTFDATAVLKRGYPYGYNALDPLNELILYTAERITDRGEEVRLLALDTGEIVWQKDTIGLQEFLQPVWDETGEHVLFVVENSSQDNYWQEIVSLNRNGETEELPLQPLPGVDHSLIVSLNRSPNDSYIFFTVARLPPLSSLGYVWDTHTGHLRELCDAPALGGTQYSVDADWIDDTHLLYLSVIEKEGVLTHSLRILDVSTWVTWEFVSVAPGYGINFFGWVQIK